MESINETRKELALITDLIHNVADKTKIINNIVVKTELLSFNASIEAARAAEHGKGFAVVAEEVGNLARLSGKSAKDIEQLLKDGTEKVQSGINQIEDKFSQSGSVVQECLEVFSRIERLNQTLVENVTSISNATNEQAKGVDQTSIAMNDISKSTQENLKITTSTADLSNRVKDEMESLKETVSKLEALTSEF
jgi:methyl-accepting chemotaxis protein